VERAILASGEPHRIIVVDNSPHYCAAEVVREYAAKTSVTVRYLQSDPRDKSKALNVGVRESDTEWLAFTDDDTLPDANWLKNAAEYAERTGLRVFGGRIVAGAPEENLPIWLIRGVSGRVPHAGVLVDYAPLPASGVLRENMPVPFGANVFVKRAVFAEHGCYDEYLWSLCGEKALGVEDGEFGVRIRDHGEPIGYSHETVVAHPVHHERCRMWTHVTLAYYYGWREIMVFFKPDRPLIEFYRLRLIAVWIRRAIVDLLRRDMAGLADNLVAVARCVGGMVGRVSKSYERWSRIARVEGRIGVRRGIARPISPLVITGMHRSGTSLIAHFAQESGFLMGRDLYPPDAGNPRGYFEDRQIVDFHKRILRRESWQMWDAETAPKVFERDRQDALGIVSSRCGETKWGWKDPRTCLFLDFWNSLLPDARYIFLFRNPFLVSDSLRRREREARWYWKASSMRLQSWCIHTEGCLSFLARHPERCLLFPLDGILRDMSLFAEILSRWLGTEFKPGRLQESFDPRGLRRTLPLSSLLVLPSVLVRTCRVYRAARRQANL
jgi:GT2 family glycosyltransferase